MLVSPRRAKRRCLCEKISVEESKEKVDVLDDLDTNAGKKRRCFAECTNE
jgi:hypothetical protein